MKDSPAQSHSIAAVIHSTALWAAIDGMCVLPPGTSTVPASPEALLLVGLLEHMASPSLLCSDLQAPKISSADAVNWPGSAAVSTCSVAADNHVLQHRLGNLISFDLNMGLEYVLCKVDRIMT